MPHAYTIVNHTYSYFTLLMLPMPGGTSSSVTCVAPKRPSVDLSTIHLLLLERRYLRSCCFFLCRLISVVTIGLVDLERHLPGKPRVCLKLSFVRSRGRARPVTRLRLYYAHVNSLSHAAYAYIYMRMQPVSLTCARVPVLVYILYVHVPCTRPSLFSACTYVRVRVTLKIWEWPGDEAMYMYILVYV